MPGGSKKACITKLVVNPSNYEFSEGRALYWCDETINGHLSVNVESLFYTRSISISLEALETISYRIKVAPKESDRNDKTVISQREFKCILFKRDILMIGDEWGSHENSRIVQLDKGTHRFRFSFADLHEKLPCSIIKRVTQDDVNVANVSLRWSVKAYIDIPDHAPTVLEHPLEIGGYQFDAMSAIPRNPDLPDIFKRSTTITYSLTPGSVVMRASINKEAFYPGENLLLHLHITNTLKHRILAVQMDVRNFAKVELPDMTCSTFETVGIGRDESAFVEASPNNKDGATFEKIWPVEIPKSGWPSLVLEKATFGMYLDVSLVVEGMMASDSSLRVPFIVLLPKPTQRLEFKTNEYRNSADQASPNPKSIPWMLDSETSNCCLCGSGFSIVQRRHHCRNCGIVICSSCSPKITDSAQWGSKPQRVCLTCNPKKKM